MAGVMTTGWSPKQLWPGLNKIWGDQYAQFEPKYLALFDKSMSEKNYEEDVGIATFGLVPAKAEGSPVTYDAMQQSYVSRYTHITYALGFIITWEAYKDNLYMDVGKRGAKQLADSYNQTREIIGANVYNNGFSGGPTYGDGVSFFNTAHPTNAGNQSNQLTTGADLSEASLEQLTIQIKTALDARGKKINLMPKKLIVPPQLEYEAIRILGDKERPGTADRDINAMFKLNSIPMGYEVNNFLTDADAFFIRTSLVDAVRYFEREAAMFADDNDFDTWNGKYKCIGRYSFGVTDWRGCFASAGA